MPEPLRLVGGFASIVLLIGCTLDSKVEIRGELRLTAGGVEACDLAIGDIHHPIRIGEGKFRVDFGTGRQGWMGSSIRIVCDRNEVLFVEHPRGPVDDANKTYIELGVIRVDAQGRRIP